MPDQMTRQRLAKTSVDVDAENAPDHAHGEGITPPQVVAVPGLARMPATPLTVGSVDDPAEAAADRAADVALRRLSSSPESHQHEDDGADIHRHADTGTGAPVVGAAGGTLDDSTASRIEGARSSGRPLPGAVRGRMEQAFGTGFGQVRVHDNPSAAALSTSISASAFTTGNDIFFGRGQFSPDTAGGERVLAHELAHTLQQSPNIGRFNPFRRGKKDKDKPAPAVDGSRMLIPSRPSPAESDSPPTTRARSGAVIGARGGQEVAPPDTRARRAVVGDRHLRAPGARHR